MERMNFTDISFELSLIPGDAVIELFVFSSINSLSYHYICSAIDALFILSLFKEDYTFIYYLT